jgi:hypothetical protein
MVGAEDSIASKGLGSVCRHDRVELHTFVDALDLAPPPPPGDYGRALLDLLASEDLSGLANPATTLRRAGFF